MRLSSFFVAPVLLVSVGLFAQHSSGGGGSHSSGSASSGSMASSHSITSSSSHSSSSARTSSASPKQLAKESSTQETKSSRSLFHPFRKPKPSQPAVLARSWPCLRRPCPVCPTGEARNGSGGCAVVTNACVSAYGFSCSVQYWSNDCGALARQLEAQRRGIQGRYDLSGSVIYQTLLDQYEQCVRRYRFGAFGSLAFNDVNLFGLP